MDLKSIVEFLEEEAWTHQEQSNKLRPHLPAGQNASYLAGQSDGVAFGLTLAAAKLRELLGNNSDSMS